MNRISEITRRDIFDLFLYGMDIEELFETKKFGIPTMAGFQKLTFSKEYIS